LFVRPPSHLSRAFSAATGFDILGHELRAEQASSLGHAARKVETTLAALRRFEGGAEAREELLSAAAEAVYAYFIQREVIGLHNTAQTVRDYGIPGEVLARLGSSRQVPLCTVGAN
jgi:uncharacterized protein DUF6665